MPFNGPTRELHVDADLPDAVTYCVDCGLVMVYAAGRDCPACTLAGLLADGTDVEVDG